MIKTCAVCNQTFDDEPPRPSYARGNKCDECSRPKPSEEQQKQWNDEQTFVTSDGRVQHFTVVRRITVDEPID
jgi:hypothetical protein